jgi:phosphatidylinositol dimannoside acyltransferase
VRPPTEGDKASRIATTTQTIASVFEREIARHPEDWHMLQPLWADDVRAREQAKEDVA